MNDLQNRVVVTFVREWHIRRPPLYRYLEREFVDQFFNCGLLRLSSFLEFSRHKDEQRHDPQEGHGMMMSKNSDGKGQVIGGYATYGEDAYVLCCSTLFDSKLGSDFRTDSGFRINNIAAFAQIIASHVPGFRMGIEGNCIYLANRTVERDIGPVDIETLKSDNEPDKIDLGKMIGTLNRIAGDDLLFVKHAGKYAHQQEYRLLWMTHAPADTHLLIKCPEAIQFCSRFEDLETAQ